jgi:hypothetical protein
MKLQVKVLDTKTGQVEQVRTVTLSRREAISKMAIQSAGALAVLSGASTFLSGCIGESDVQFGTFEVDNTPTPTPGCTDRTNSAPAACVTAVPARTIKSYEQLCLSKGSHDHALDLTIAQIEAEVALDPVYLLETDTAGLSVSHVHWFSLTAEQLQSLKAGQALTITTDFDNSGDSVGGPANPSDWGHIHVIQISCLA